MRFAGYRFYVTVYSYYKVAIAKTEDTDEIEDAALAALSRMFEHDTDITVLDKEVQEINQDNKYFTIADVGMELRVRVTAHDIDDAFGEADGYVRENSERKDLPNGVAFFECESIDGEQETEECWID